VPETRNILLVEPDYLLRRTVVAAARSLFEVEIDETSRYENALTLVKSHRYDGLILALDDVGDQALALVQQLRAGALLPAHDSPVVLMGYDPDRRRAEIIQVLAVQRFVRKPVKVRHILEALVQMAPLRAGVRAQMNVH
jgi:CheY-like chemotaxis protein